MQEGESSIEETMEEEGGQGTGGQEGTPWAAERNGRVPRGRRLLLHVSGSRTAAIAAALKRWQPGTRIVLEEDEERAKIKKSAQQQPPAQQPPPAQTLDQQQQLQGAVGGEGGGNQRRMSDPGARLKVRKSPPLGEGNQSEGEDRDDKGLKEATGEEQVGVQTRALTAKLKASKQEVTAPLRQVDQIIVNQQGQVERQPLFQYVPFTTTDLLNRKQHYGPLTTKPTEMADLFQTIMLTHNPTWQDVQQLLRTLLTPEEREKWKEAVRQCVKEMLPNDADVQPEVLVRAPEIDPGWDPKEEQDRTRLEEPPPEPLVTMRIGGQQTTFLVDTGAGRSVVNKQIAAPGSRKIQVQGVSGQIMGWQVLKPVMCDFKGAEIQHEFLYIPECPIPLLGRDLLSKLGATISFDEGSQKMTIRHSPEEIWRLMIGRQVGEKEKEEKWRMFDVPGLWAEDNPPGFAAHHPPVVVELKPGAMPVRIRQRPVSWEAIYAIYESIQKYLEAGVLVPTQSPWNTPIIPIKKADGSYRPAQDLRFVNRLTVTLHPAMSNPYTLLNLIPPQAGWFSVVDLKDAFFTIPVHPSSQPLFAFEWENPHTGTKMQYTWTRLPQGFKNSPTLFGTALARDLQYYMPQQPGDTILQYVDDVLVTGQTEDLCWDNTKMLLDLLLECGYRVSRKKAQLVKERVRYLGYDIEKGHRALGPERKQAVLMLAEPRTKRQLRSFLGLAGFCRIWIPNFALMAAPLYVATRGANTEPLEWGEEQKKAFKDIKLALTQAPALALPNLQKPFNLYVDTSRNIAVGVLTQPLGSWQQLVAYLSKQLDGVARGWPHCLKVLAAIEELIQDCNKLTFSCPINVHSPHAVQSVLDAKGHLWISGQRLAKYQAIMIENPQVRLVMSNRLNPATLLPTEVDTQHDCLQVLDKVYSTCPDLTDIPLPNAQFNWYTDGSSYIVDGYRVSGYAIVDDEGVVESGPLGSGHSAQVAGLWALIRALERAKGETLNVWTDSKYAFLTLHAHGAVYKERGFRDSAGKSILHGHLISRLIEAVNKPKKVAVMHCKGHQRGDDKVAIGNRAADVEAREAAKQEGPLPDLSVCVAMDLGVIPPEIKPTYTQQESVKAVTDLKAQVEDGWYKQWFCG
ncbi:uncharacterized protein [Pituophis catenifer annectens]|uniref:uncharacterized protein n=1 Tax=Pituophis catenifer annectens TaxID=94852 RepID=UPI00399406FF